MSPARLWLLLVLPVLLIILSPTAAVMFPRRLAAFQLQLPQRTRGRKRPATAAPRRASHGKNAKRSRTDWEALKVVELKEHLRAAGLPVSGRKAELVERLLSASTAQGLAAEVSVVRAAATTKQTQAKRKEMAIRSVQDKRPVVPRGKTTRRSAAVDGEQGVARFVSWNVNGLRALLKRPQPLVELMRRERPHVLCLQETKLQTQHVEDCEAALRELLPPEYSHFSWECSAARKGYSGVALIIDPSRFAPGLWDQATVSTGIGVPDADIEGRSLTLSVPPLLSLTTVYVPNSGAELKRLSFRTTDFDRGLSRHLQRAADTASCALLCGDLNVAHKNSDFYNPDEARTLKQAGTTPEERESISRTLQDTGWVDTFRQIHPDTEGVFSYWSTRARNRPVNRGLRLDYFLACPAVASCTSGTPVLDAYILDDINGSDHCPVGLDVALPGLVK